MSVPVNMRKEGRLKVYMQAHELVCYTLKITANDKIFIKDFQTSLTDRINDLVLVIWSDLWFIENYYDHNDKKKERKHRKSTAFANCDILLSYIAIAKSIFHLDSRRIQYWTGLVVDLKDSIYKA